ncbi:MAG: CDP-diacylglycerol--serine O-phosphatidyltransferase [Ruminococcaceae bacterium]|nr:CDP-diacylglycerol--serine O-phosphatidyltransferase [Oscillospiraceae bacterium]
MKFIGVYDYTVILTYTSLVSGLISMKCAYEGKPGLAILCLMLSGICDLFDGVVARTKKGRTEDEKNFGIQLDSLCDVVCFGVVPAVFLYFSGVNTVLGLAVLFFYVLCAVIRLAFFNVLETKRQTTEGGCAKEYRGLPVTTASMIFPLLYLIGLKVSEDTMVIIYYVVAFLTAVLFIADFRVPKVDIGKLLSKKK